MKVSTPKIKAMKGPPVQSMNVRPKLKTRHFSLAGKSAFPAGAATAFGEPGMPTAQPSPVPDEGSMPIEGA